MVWLSDSVTRLAGTQIGPAQIGVLVYPQQEVFFSLFGAFA
jgi:hypothetical protein